MREKKSSTFEKSIQELNDIIEQSYHFEQTLFKIKKDLEKNYKRISELMGSNSRYTFPVDESIKFSAKKVVKVDLEFLQDQLAKTLGKDLYKQVIDKEVIINDTSSLVKMLKSYGVQASEFKKFITVRESLNKEKIDELIETDQISVDRLQGCYTAKVSEEIIVKKIK